MNYFSKLKQLLPGNINVGRTLQENFGHIVNIISGEKNAGLIRRQLVFNSLVFEILQEEGVIVPARQAIYRRLLEDSFDHRFAEKSINELLEHSHLPLEEAVSELKNWEPRQRQRAVEFLLSLAVAVGNNSEHIKMVFRICGETGGSREELNVVYSKLCKELREQKFAISSGWGLLVAVAVIVVFIIAAKLLESVIYGLIVACILLPMEKFFERRIRKRRGFVFQLVNIFSVISYPLTKFSRMITRKEKKLSMIAGDSRKKRKKAQQPIIQAVTLTVAVALLILTAAVAVFTFLTSQYMDEVRGSLRHMEVRRQYEQRQSGQEEEGRMDYYVERLRDRFQNLPLVRSGLDYLSKVLQEPETQQQMLGGFYGDDVDRAKVVAAIARNVINILCNILLSIFFAMLFLIKLAQFCQNDDSDRQKSEYLIRFVFNGVWLPKADEKVVGEARRIIEGVFYRLRVWLKGYMTLVLVDASVYTVIFFFLGLPFFLPLGLIAGCGILLPYLGPVISCIITVFVSLAIGDVSGNTLLLIIISYLIYNGIIEQFILYPAVIGEALGLSTLETIIVVLLGAVFGGITGMLLALPVASVAKYIVPQLHHSFIHRRIGKKIGKAG